MPSVEQFKASFGDLARPNRFQVILARAGNLQMFCKATDVPPQSVDAMDANYQGRIIKLPGDRTNPDWTITVYGSTAYDIYNSFVQWMAQINDPEQNVGDVPVNLKEDPVVQQLDRQGNIINTWVLVGAFPTELGQLSFDWGSNSTPVEFQVTFAFDYTGSSTPGG